MSVKLPRMSVWTLFLVPALVGVAALGIWTIELIWPESGPAGFLREEHAGPIVFKLFLEFAMAWLLFFLVHERLEGLFTRYQAEVIQQLRSVSEATGANLDVERVEAALLRIDPARLPELQSILLKRRLGAFPQATELVEAIQSLSDQLCEGRQYLDNYHRTLRLDTVADPKVLRWDDTLRYQVKTFGRGPGAGTAFGFLHASASQLPELTEATLRERYALSAALVTRDGTRHALPGKLPIKLSAKRSTVHCRGTPFEITHSYRADMLTVRVTCDVPFEDLPASVETREIQQMARTDQFLELTTRYPVLNAHIVLHLPEGFRISNVAYSKLQEGLWTGTHDGNVLDVTCQGWVFPGLVLHAHWRE